MKSGKRAGMRACCHKVFVFPETVDTLYTYTCPPVQVFAVADLYWYYSHILWQSVIPLLLNHCRHSCNEVHNIFTAVQFSQKVPVSHPEFISHLAALSDFLTSDTDKYRESFLWEAVSVFLILSQCESHVKHLPVGWTFFSFFFFFPPRSEQLTWIMQDLCIWQCN